MPSFDDVPSSSPTRVERILSLIEEEASRRRHPSDEDKVERAAEVVVRLYGSESIENAVEFALMMEMKASDRMFARAVRIAIERKRTMAGT
jgi:hypothetical protein